jgi:hypothetical protein
MKIAVAVVLCVACMLLALLSPELAMPNTRPAPRLRVSHKSKTPPAYWIRTALLIGYCEQPSGRGKPGQWSAINWKNTKNYSFPGGLGMTRLLYETFRKIGQPHEMSNITPMEQVAVAWRAYRWYASRFGEGYAATMWDCDRIIGFNGFNPDGSWR